MKNFFIKFLSKESFDDLAGDIAEEYNLVKKERGAVQGIVWLMKQLFTTLISLLKSEAGWRSGLFRSFLKSAFRTLLRQKAYSFVNITGLALGICAVILIMVYIGYEYSYENIHEKRESIYRICIKTYKGERHMGDSTYYPPPLGEEMTRVAPEVKDFATMSGEKKRHVVVGKRGFMVDGIRYTTSGILRVFSFGLKNGVYPVDFDKPFKVILTRSLEKRLFGDETSIGKLIGINGTGNYQVVSVIDDPPGNSHLKFEMLVSFSSLAKDRNIYIHKNPASYLGWNGGHQYVSYLQLRKGSSAEAVQKRAQSIADDKVNRSSGPWYIKPVLQKLGDIHLHHTSPVIMRNIKIFSLIAVFILLIACINFVNMSTVGAVKRAKEIGVRKVMGAERQGLIKQFLTESSVLSSAGFAGGFILASLVGGRFFSLLGRELDFWGAVQVQYFVPGILLALTVGVLAGLYPAFYLSSCSIDGNFKKGARKGKFFRNGLVILQFAISIVLIAATILVNGQIKFMKNRDLGFQKENMLYLPLSSRNAAVKSHIIKKKIMEIPGIKAVGGVSQLPGKGFTMNGYRPQGKDEFMMINVVDVDSDFFRLFGITVKDGRGFLPDNSGDMNRYVVNEKFADVMGWSRATGKRVERNGIHEIIGVVKDFSFDKGYKDIAPLIITARPWDGKFNYLVFRTSGNIDGAELLNRVEAVWRDTAPLTPFEPGFLEDDIDNLYRSEERFEGLFFWFSCIALGIALLGVISLASYSVEQRLREIGVRKVLGASGMSIFGMFSLEFVILITVGNVLALPIVWYWGNLWLENFVHRISVTPDIFLLSLFISVFMGVLVVSFQIIRGVNSNPVEVLKCD